MLREYIDTRYKTNKAMREELEEQIHMLQEEHQAAEEALKELQKDQDIEKSIFSPRSQLGGTPEKLAEIRTKLTETEKKLEATGTKQQAVQKEEQEMEQLLTEVLELQRVADGQAVGAKEEKVEALESPVTIENVDAEKEPETAEEQSEHIESERETESEAQNENLDNATNVVEIQTEKRHTVEQVNAEAKEEIKTGGEWGGSKKNEIVLGIPEKADETGVKESEKSKTESELEKVNEIGMTKETGSGESETTSEMSERSDEIKKENGEEEKQEQTLDMERLNDLLSDVYRKAEFCTAFLYSDKNKCRNLLKEMKKELKKYAEEIAGM